ncbi:MAG: hypothetical protein R3293_09360 [Candidatus Promineifilaceae bacterium]|nr:hypothetical protein [Candidatus Promineifilaceae bacterium]
MNKLIRHLIKWLPRLLIGGLIAALFLLFINQFSSSLPFMAEPEREPGAETQPPGVTTSSETKITLAADLSADPGQVPLYSARPQPVPATPEEALAWAREFGLSDPQIFRPLNTQDNVLIVRGEDDEALVFQNFNGFTEIVYSFPSPARADEEPLAFEEAAAIATTFLETHRLLPDSYKTEPARDDSGPLAGIIFRPQVESGVIGGDAPGSGLRVSVDARGQVAHAVLSRIDLQPAGSTRVISAQAAYDDLLNNRHILRSTTYLAASGADPVQTYQPPLPAWNIGQEAELAGYVNALENVQTGEILAEVTDPGGGIYHLTGPEVAALGEEAYRGALRIRGTVLAQESRGAWRLEVQEWESAWDGVDSYPCLTGTITRQNNSARFQSEQGLEYGLPHPPEEVEDGRLLEVCLAAPAEPGEDLAWHNIHVPPRGSGVPPGGTVTETMVVEELSVTRVVVEEVESEEGSTVGELVPPPEPTPVPTPTPNPFELGDEVELIGLVQLYRIVDEEGAEHFEATFLHDDDLQRAGYPTTYPLITPAALLEELAEFHNRHIRLHGRIVPSPQDSFLITRVTGHEQAIDVQSFDHPWPAETMEQFLGHFQFAAVAGQEVLLFIDHATDEKFVINPPNLPPEAYEHDDTLQEEQVLLTGMIHPLQTFDGLPLLDRRGVSSGAEINAAADTVQFILESFSEIPTINEAEIRAHQGGVAGLYGDVVIETVELTYPYQPYAHQDSAADAPQLLEPAWAFSGYTKDGRERFTIMVKAVADS